MFFKKDKKIHKIFLKTFVLVLIFSFFTHTSTVLAQGTGSSAANDPQVKAYTEGAEKKEGGASASAKTIAVDLLGCSAGQLLSNLIQSGLNSLFGSLTGQLKNQVVRLVPIDTQYTEIEKDTKQQTAAHTMQSIFGVPFGSSWDAMAWCIVNSIITDIANKTIAWANSGFNGKPAFIENPERFFQGLADREAATFVQNLAYGTTGINLCQPFRVEVAIALSESYGNSYYNQAGGAAGRVNAYNSYSRRASCTLDQMVNNVQNFGANNISVGTTRARLGGYWTRFRETSKEQNNPWGSYMLATDFLNARITNQQNTARFELGLNQGWMNFKKCEDENDPQSCNTYTPGTLIQHSLEKSLDIPKDRLVAVQKFDQVITAIVNNLIKVALDKALESANK